VTPVERVWNAKVTINSDQPFTSSLNVEVAMEADGATEVSLHTDLGSCLASDNWMVLQSSANLDLSNANVENTVCAKFRDAAGHRSDCRCDSITHDGLTPRPPSQLALKWTGGVSLTKTPQLDFEVSTDRGLSGVESYRVRILDAITESEVEGWHPISLGGTLDGLTTLVSGTSYILEVQALDAAGNPSVAARSAPWTDQSVSQVISAGAMHPRRLIAEDIDNDGDNDLVIIEEGYSHLFWKENLDGNGSMSEQQLLINDSLVTEAVKLIDLNGDGYLDILGSNGSGIIWYKNERPDWNGFSEKQVIDSTTTNIQILKAVDIDNDGLFDIAVVTDTSVIWFKRLQNSLGFSIAPNIMTIAGPLKVIEFIDINGDQLIDLVMARGSPSQLYKYINQGAGAFSSAELISSANFWYLKAADIDRDGDNDLVTNSGWYRNQDGLGAFSSLVTYSAPVDLLDFDVGDIDGDGDFDLVSADQSFNDDLVWLENDGSGNFTTRYLIYSIPFGEDYGSALLVKLNADSYVDVVYAQSDPGTVGWFFNTSGLGDFSAVEYGAPGATSFAVADITGDSKLDLITSTEMGLLIQKGNPGGFSVPTKLSPNVYSKVKCADLDGDGDQDILVGAISSLGWYQNLDGAGSFSSYIAITTALNGLSFVDIKDLDNDGKVDILTAASMSSKLAWHHNLGSGSFSSQLLIATELPQFQSIGATDLDADGDLDIVGTNYNGIFSNSFLVWYRFNSANLTFSGSVQSVPIGRITDFKLADIDNDGDDDVLTTFSGAIALYKNNGGTFSTANYLTTAPITATGIAVFDYDRDGNNDIIFADYSGGKLMWKKNQGVGTFAEPLTIGTGISEAKLLVEGDLNGDGSLDVIVNAPVTNSILWFANPY
jgi:hypothetical protein